MNTLVRSGDIELVDYIEPVQPPHSYQPKDLENLNYEPYNCYDRASSFNMWGNPPTYNSDPLPSFDGIYRINCPLEDYINQDLILIFLFLLMIIIILRNKILNYFRKSDNLFFTDGISVNEITFTKDYQDILSKRLGDSPPYSIIYWKTEYHDLVDNWTLFDILEWFKKLEDQDYVVNIEVISLKHKYCRIFLNNEFIVNSSSNPVMISTYLSNQLKKAEEHCFLSIFKDEYTITISYSILTPSLS